MTDNEIKEKLIRLLAENELKYDMLANYNKYSAIYAHKTVDEMVKILTKAGVDPAEINKIMEGV